MMVYFVLYFVLLSVVHTTYAQHAPYSLQAAVDALHRREAQLALRENYLAPQQYRSPENDDFGYDDSEGEDSPAVAHMPNQKLNKVLARYLQQEGKNEGDSYAGIGPIAGYTPNYDEYNYLTDEKKRSFFRERGEKNDSPYSAIFRERDPQSYTQPELAEEFLRQIEEARESEREEKYKDALRSLWEKYQQQENEIEDELFDGQKRNAAPNNYYNGLLMQKKRTYPVLPWLPMSRRKRFPVAKRSPKVEESKSADAEDKMAKDLEELFGKTVDEKKKRSTDSQMAPNVSQNSTGGEGSVHAGHDGHRHNHQHKAHEHQKRSDDVHNSKESHEHHDHDEEDSEEHDEHEEDDEEEEQEHDHDEHEDDEEEERKKKRDTSSKVATKSDLELVRGQQTGLPVDASISRRKKSIEWSKYFGIDRRKKSSPAGSRASLDNSPHIYFEGGHADLKEIPSTVDSKKLDNMDKKLQSIEDLIIDETVKYTGAHEGITNPVEISLLKNHVMSRLAAAYSLEKMRRALENLRQSVENESHLQRNEIEGTNEVDDEKRKRLSVKKEKADLDSSHQSVDSHGSEKTKDVPSNTIISESDEGSKKKKRTRYQKYPLVHNELKSMDDELGAGHFEPLNDAYLGSKSSNSYQCPILDSMAERCRGVDILSGDLHQELLPICGVHQICYLCGTSQRACDLQYLSDADSICRRNGDCESAARAAMLMLRGSPGPQLGPKECLKNPCLFRVMREIGL